MSFQDMSQTRKRAWLSTAIWTLAGVGFALTFFSGGGAGEFDTDSTRHLAGAGAIAFGFLAHWATLWLTRQRGERLSADERDVQVVAKAGQVTLVVVLVGIYAFTIGLWTVYEGAGVVPVGWMWVMAYSTLILSHLAPALVALVLDLGAVRHAEG